MRNKVAENNLKRVSRWIARDFDGGGRTRALSRLLVGHCLGFGSFWAWNFCVFWSEVVVGRPQDFSSGGSLRVEALLAIILTLALLALLSRRFLRNVTPLAVTAAGMGMLGPTLVATSQRTPLLSGVGFVLIGTAYASQELLWSQRYDGIPEQTAWKVTVPGSMLVGIAVFLIIEMLPFGLGFYVSLLLPPFSMLLIAISRRIDDNLAAGGSDVSGQDGELADGNRHQRPLPLRLVLNIGLFGIALGFVTEIVVVSFPVYSQVSLSALSSVLLVLLAVTAYSAWSNRGSPFRMAHYALLPMIATALLITSILDSYESLVVVAILNVAIFVFGEIYFWSILAAQAKLRGQPPVIVFGLGQCAKVIGLVTGMYLVYMIQGQPEATASAIVIMLYLLVFAALITNNPITLSFTESQMVSILEQNQEGREATDESERSGLVALEAAIQQKCRAIAEQYNLSSREEEVLEKLVSGYKLQAIANELFITENTSKAHTKHIYQKLGVHTRQELVNFFRYA